MNIYFFPKMDACSSSYHHEGWFVAVAGSVEEAQDMILEYQREVVGLLVPDYHNYDEFDLTPREPRDSFPLAENCLKRLITFPDKGCCQ
jgi:hypothetical protein